MLWLFKFHEDQIFVDFIGFLSMVIYEVLYTWCWKHNICSAWFLDIRIFLCRCLYMCVCVCVCECACLCECASTPRLLITTGMIWTLYDWLNKLYSFYVATVVSIISRCGLGIDAHCENQPNKHKLVLYKPSIHFNSSLKWLYLSNKAEHFS